MNRLLTAKDIAERYGKSEKTAMRYMRQMVHMEKPLRVTEQAVEAWENERTYEPVTVQKAPVTQVRARRSRPVPGSYTISRIRPEIQKNR